ncbi:MAG TPA: sulfite exporter TauE/SafE family protein [Mycobacteriales bacterium]|nr:sulfite exporter TauE/SafE family protein [Mycobacteriales bacterium]
MEGLSAGVLTLLALIGLVGGIGVAAVGPGGVLPTIGLFVLTPLAPATVAGTAIATNIGTGVAGTVAYTISGQLRDRATRRTAWILAATAVLGTPPGVLVNAHVSKRLFGILLAAFVVVVAFLVWLRGRTTRVAAHPRDAVVAGLGLVVGAASGLLGLGGPLLTVPLLVALGVDALQALAAAQAQSVVIATVGTIAYAVSGRVDWGLVLLIGLPELAGVLLGWRIARALPTRTLRLVLIVVLLALAPYLALRS